MHILYVVPYTPTPIRTRPHNLIRFLARRGHAITLATLWENEDERAFLQTLGREEGVAILAEPLGAGRKLVNLAAGIFSRAPIQARFCWNPALARTLSAATANGVFDVIHVEHLRGVRYALHLQAVLSEAHTRPPIVWDSVDSITYLFQQAAQQSQSLKGRLMTTLELGRTRRYEAWLLSRFQQVLVTSPRDKAAFQSLLDHQPTAPITVLPNGVDLHYFSPDGTLRKPATIVFTGKMSYHANVTAAVHLVKAIMPLVWRRRPDVRVVIVGKDPTREVRALASGEPRVTVTGFVADLRPYLRQATMAVSPIRYGAGIQNKVLEAMACGTPVIASSLAISALAVEPGRDLLVADDPPSFAESILRMLESPSLRQRLGAAGRAYVESNHDWAKIVARLEGIYQSN